MARKCLVLGRETAARERKEGRGACRLPDPLPGGPGGLSGLQGQLLGGGGATAAG